MISFFFFPNNLISSTEIWKAEKRNWETGETYQLIRTLESELYMDPYSNKQTVKNKLWDKQGNMIWMSTWIFVDSKKLPLFLTVYDNGIAYIFIAVYIF